MIEAVQEKMDKCDRKYELANTVVEEATEALAAEKDKSRPLEEERRGLRDRFDSSRRELYDIHVYLLFPYFLPILILRRMINEEQGRK